MMSAIGGCMKVSQRQLEEGTSARELHKAEIGKGLDNYNKTDKQNEGCIVTTMRLATVTTHKWIIMLKVWFRGNSDAQSQEPNLPHRRWPRSVMWILLLLLLLLVLAGSTWLSASRRPSVNQADEIAILLQKYGSLTNQTKFGDILVPTSWASRHSPLVGDIFKLKRAVQILKCSSDSKGPNTTTGMHAAPVANNDGHESIDEGISYGEPVDDCPPYFNWIHEDLAPWKESGISRRTLDLGKKNAAFRAIIVKGTLYIDLHKACFQSRLLFTIWGLLLLLEKYQNKIPDVEFMFNCLDTPRARINTNLAVPLFSYTSNREHYDIPWPDWSFWGWSELQLESWEIQLDKIAKGSKKKDWRQKHKKTYWMGDPSLGDQRGKQLVEATSFGKQLLLCHNTTENPQVDVIIQGWSKDYLRAKQISKLEDQCTHRYMVYAEGVSWSVSLKYMMACGSPTMVVSPNYYEFYQRGLQPGVHYIRVEPHASCVSKLCQKLNEVVENAELNVLRGEGIGEAGQAFLGKEVSMDKVYDYMYHMLLQYAQLQEFRPMVSRSAHLVTQDYILCLAEPTARVLLIEARKHMSATAIPCTMSQASSFKDYGWEAYKHVNRTC